MGPQQASEVVNSVFQEWTKPLVRYAICRLRNREIAEEIVQEVFLSLYRKLISGSSIDNPGAWTLAAVRNLVRKHHRDQNNENQKLSDCTCVGMATRDMEAHLVELDSLEVLLHVLTEREEEVLLLRMESMRYDEIAAELNITSGTVATLLSRAIQKIKRSQQTDANANSIVSGRRILERQPLQ
jgi:RNA polymerase sigma factor (sigma-70 family)